MVVTGSYQFKAVFNIFIPEGKYIEVWDILFKSRGEEVIQGNKKYVGDVDRRPEKTEGSCCGGTDGHILSLGTHIEHDDTRNQG